MLPVVSRREKILLLLRSMIASESMTRPKLYLSAKPGPIANKWIDCRAGCTVGFYKSHGRVTVCTRCGGRGLELVDPYLEEWLGDVGRDTAAFHDRLDLRRQLDRELQRLEHLASVRRGREAPLDPLISCLARSQVLDRTGSYPALRRALERLSMRFPIIAHVVVWAEVYGIQACLSSRARRYHEAGLNLLSKWMPDKIRIPKWLEPPRQERLMKVEVMLSNGWKTKRIARSLKISQGKAKRLARTAQRSASA